MSLYMVDAEVLLVLLALVSLDSLRKAEAGTVFFQRTLLGEWRAADEVRAARWTLPSPLTPLTMAVAAPARVDRMPTFASVAERYGVATRIVRRLRWLGTMEIAFLVVGVPVGAYLRSGFGLLVMLGLVLSLCATIALVSWFSWRRLNFSRPGFRVVCSWLSPFSSSASAQVLLQEALRGAPAVHVASLLLAPKPFRRWVRPRAYDVLNGLADLSLQAVLSEEDMHSIIEEPPDGDADAAGFCSRCGTAWRYASGQCSSCGVALSAVVSVAA